MASTGPSQLNSWSVGRDVKIEINEALRTYLGSDPNGGVRPYDMVERVRERYGANSAEVLALIESALQGLLDIPDAQWRKSIENIVGFLEQRARRSKPEFDNDVCKAIGTYALYLSK